MTATSPSSPLQKLKAIINPTAMKVRTRMLLAFLAAGVLALAYLMFVLDEKIKPIYLAPLEEDLVDQVTLLASDLSLSADEEGVHTARLAAAIERGKARKLNAVIYKRKKEKLNVHIYVANTESMIIYDSDNGRDVGKITDRRDVYQTLRGEYGARASWVDTDGVRKLWLYVAAPVYYGDRMVGVVSVGKASPVEAFNIMERVRTDAFYTLYGAVFLGVILAILFTVWVTRPIRMLTEYADAIRDGRRASLPSLGRSDIGRLGRSFEEMRDALEGKQYVEQYVQTLTHEIKSPLSAIKGAAELLDDDMPQEGRARFLANIRLETARIQRIVERMLELSAIENRKELRNVRSISLKTELEEVLNSAAPLMEGKNLTLDVDLDDITIDSERFLIHQALSNLIQNAVDFSPRGGRIHVQLKPGHLLIEDEGPGIPDYAQPRVFERFYSLQRPDSGKKSSGLGLSIVKQVAELHGATISLSNRPKGGASASLKF